MEEVQGFGNGGMELYLHRAGALIVPIQESDYHPTTQSLDRDQKFGGEFLAVSDQKVSLDFTRMSPLETTE
jgi:hypothetical protein